MIQGLSPAKLKPAILWDVVFGNGSKESTT